VAFEIDSLCNVVKKPDRECHEEGIRRKIFYIAKTVQDCNGTIRYLTYGELLRVIMASKIRRQTLT
jgi:hypothetical protein